MRTQWIVKLPGHRPGLPGHVVASPKRANEISFLLCPLTPPTGRGSRDTCRPKIYTRTLGMCQFKRCERFLREIKNVLPSPGFFFHGQEDLRTASTQRGEVVGLMKTRRRISPGRGGKERRKDKSFRPLTGLFAQLYNFLTHVRRANLPKPGENR
jgi:hypothetical protein